MRSRDLGSWMWGDALSLLEQADRLHRQFFQNGPAEGRCWEPPVDVVETADEVLIHIRRRVRHGFTASKFPTAVSSDASHCLSMH
jgi:hypothetical protein